MIGQKDSYSLSGFKVMLLNSNQTFPDDVFFWGLGKQELQLNGLKSQVLFNDLSGLLKPIEDLSFTKAEA